MVIPSEDINAVRRTSVTNLQILPETRVLKITVHVAPEVTVKVWVVGEFHHFGYDGKPYRVEKIFETRNSALLMAAAYQPSSFRAYVSYVLLILVARLTNGSLKHRHDAVSAERRHGKSVRNTKGIIYACIYLFGLNHRRIPGLILW